MQAACAAGTQGSPGQQRIALAFAINGMTKGKAEGETPSFINEYRKFQCPAGHTSTAKVSASNGVNSPSRRVKCRACKAAYYFTQLNTSNQLNMALCVSISSGAHEDAVRKR